MQEFHQERPAYMLQVSCQRRFLTRSSSKTATPSSRVQLNFSTLMTQSR